jgi:hypothetical protein
MKSEPLEVAKLTLGCGRISRTIQRIIAQEKEV